MEESTNTTAWTSSASATPSMTSPSTVSTGSPHVIRGVLPRTTTSAGTQDRVLSVDVLSRVVWSFVWTVKTEYTLYSSKYLRYSCKFKQTYYNLPDKQSLLPDKREVQSGSNFTWLTDKKSSNQKYSSWSLITPIPSKSSNPSWFPSPKFRTSAKLLPVHTLLPYPLPTFFNWRLQNTGCLQTDNKGEVTICILSNFIKHFYPYNNLKIFLSTEFYYWLAVLLYSKNLIYVPY